MKTRAYLYLYYIEEEKVKVLMGQGRPYTLSAIARLKEFLEAAPHQTLYDYPLSYFGDGNKDEYGKDYKEYNLSLKILHKPDPNILYLDIKENALKYKVFDKTGTKTDIIKEDELKKCDFQKLKEISKDEDKEKHLEKFLPDVLRITSRRRHTQFKYPYKYGELYGYRREEPTETKYSKVKADEIYDHILNVALGKQELGDEKGWGKCF